MTDEGTQCPICKKNNDCGNEQGKPLCWCDYESFPQDIFKLELDDKKNVACICKECLEKDKEKIKG